MRLLLVGFLAATTSWAQDGVVCVTKLPAPNGEPVMNPDSSKAAGSYRVRVDQAAWQVVDAKQGARFEGLARGEKHQVQIAISGRVIESFKFRFDGTSQRRLWLKSGYYTWSLSPDDCATSASK